jgi:hypothetical protein
MRRLIAGPAMAGLAACALGVLAIAGTFGPVVAGKSAVAATVTPGPSVSGNGDQCITVKGSGTVLTLSQPDIEPGIVCFNLSTTNPGLPGGMGGSSMELFALHPGVTLQQVVTEFQQNFSGDWAAEALGTRELLRDVSFYGLGDVTPANPETVTEYLPPGTYYLWDDVNTFLSGHGQNPVFDTFTVTQNTQGQNSGTTSLLSSGRRFGTVVTATSSDTFSAPTTWPHQGTILFQNTGNSHHLMSMIPVIAGTTDALVQAFFDANSNVLPQNLVSPAFAGGTWGGVDVVSPGQSVAVSYNLPPGTYVLLCWIPDAQMGRPHAYMGMHLVIKLT